MEPEWQKSEGGPFEEVQRRQDAAESTVLGRVLRDERVARERWNRKLSRVVEIRSRTRRYFNAAYQYDTAYEIDLDLADPSPSHVTMTMRFVGFEAGKRIEVR